jgi:hypothetical protein
VRIIHSQGVLEKNIFHKVYGQATFLKEKYKMKLALAKNSRGEFVTKQNIRIDLLRLYQDKLEKINSINFDILQMMNMGMKYFNGDLKGDSLNCFGSTRFGLVISIKEIVTDNLSKTCKRRNRFQQMNHDDQGKGNQSQIKSLELKYIKKKDLNKINNLLPNINHDNKDSEDPMLNFWFVGSH